MVEYDVNVGNQALVQVVKQPVGTPNTNNNMTLAKAMMKDALQRMQFTVAAKVIEIRTRLEKGEMTEKEFIANISLFRETLEQVNTGRHGKLLKQCMPEFFKQIETLVCEVEYRCCFIKQGKSTFDDEVDRFIKIFDKCTLLFPLI